MGITTIKRIENNSSQAIKVFNFESPGDRGSNQLVDSGLFIEASMWVPWCGAARDYPAHHIGVELGGAQRFGIWQADRSDGDYVRFNNSDAWADPGSKTFGFPEVNGERALVVHPDSIELLTIPATITSFPDDLLGRHHGWHRGGHGGWPGRNIPSGQPGSGDEFLTFHADFIRDFKNWYAGHPGSQIVPWTELPQAMKNHPAWSNFEADYARLSTNTPLFSSSDELGIFIERGIHNRFLHDAAADTYDEPLLKDAATSPLSAYFYKIHGLVQRWSELWSMQNTPFGFLDSAQVVQGGIRVAGWALDPNTSASIEVQIYLDGVFGKSLQADLSRPDVAAAYPGHGELHGFDVSLSAVAGVHQVCVYAINVGPGAPKPNIGCATVRIKGKEKDSKEDDKLRKENDKARKEMDMLEGTLVQSPRFGKRLGDPMALQAVHGVARHFIGIDERPDAAPEPATIAAPVEAGKIDEGATRSRE